MNYPAPLKNLIECYRKLPGIGEKTAERLALATLSLDDETINIYTKSIKDLKTKIKRCSICNNFAEEDLCNICKDKDRDHNLICVVEEPKNVMLFEKMGTYQGVYHVLDGLISPLDGTNPDDIKISLLMDRINKNSIEEIILAVKPSIEGQTTGLYISKKLEGKNIVVTKIASGIPMGAEMDYIDILTLEMALEDRITIS